MYQVDFYYPTFGQWPDTVDLESDRTEGSFATLEEAWEVAKKDGQPYKIRFESMLKEV